MASRLANGTPAWSRLIRCDIAKHLYDVRATNLLAFDYGLLGQTAGEILATFFCQRVLSVAVP